MILENLGFISVLALSFQRHVGKESEFYKLLDWHHVKLPLCNIVLPNALLRRGKNSYWFLNFTVKGKKSDCAALFLIKRTSQS